MTHSLDRLSDRERELLILLAQGHTAKTIARSRELSVNVVNEHLRSARRKTEAPSSRELARRLVSTLGAPPQENEDNLFGIERPAGTANRSLERGAAFGAWAALTWRLTMTFGVLIAAGMLAWQTSVPAEADPSYRSSSGPLQTSATARFPDITYQVIFLRGEEWLGSPTVLGQFGREVRVEIPNTMRVNMITHAPAQDGRAYTSATMSLFQDDAWKPVKTMSMNAILSATPSFEYSVDGTPYRFVVMPRLIVPPADEN